ncbi:MAG: response regulator [Candidatus Omnitrophica bacterium]|nr:response regulator [Candidatus Omnitrophota bacterium]
MAKERVLVVDDEREFVDVISERLGAKGFDILRAFDGKEGIERAQADKPDLIILDIAMPEMNGYDVCRKLKLDEKFKDTPIIILTAKFQPNDIRFGVGMGADAYLTKPLELEPLLQTVKALLKVRKRRIRESVGSKPRKS